VKLDHGRLVANENTPGSTTRSTTKDREDDTPTANRTGSSGGHGSRALRTFAVTPFLAKVAMLAALLAFSLATAGLLLHREPFYTWYYCLAWWSYILFAQAWLYCRGGTSLLFETPARFFLLLPMSLQIWLVFEAYNLRMDNWGYVDVPVSTVVRWTGYVVSFATVLPAILTTAGLIQHSKLIPQRQCSPRPSLRRWYPVMILLALAFLLLPVLWPRYFFPLVWGGFILLLEPLNYHVGTNSLLRDWEDGSWHRSTVLLVAGACCGLLWEFWNFWAGTKWVYTIPYVHYFQVFEMPILGFLGFPPFALECYVMMTSAQVVAAKLKGCLSSRWYAVAWIAFTIFVVLFDYWIFSAMDQYTVVSYRT
jgi:hypothetical protein